MKVDKEKLDIALAKIFAHGPGTKRPAKAKPPKKKKLPIKPKA